MTFTADPWPSPDGSALYFASDRTGGLGGKDLWRVDRLTPSTFGTPEPLSALNSVAASATVRAIGPGVSWL